MRAQQLIRLLTLGVLVALGAARAHAEPYFVVRSGAKCSDCHVNQTGGGMRTPFAYIHAHDILKDLDILPIPKGVKAFNGQINSYLAVGGDFRVSDTLTFEDTPNAAGRVPRNRAFRDHLKSNDLGVDEVLFYGKVDLWPDIVTLYVDEDFNGGATNREAFALLHGILPWGTYLKAGRFFPAYGLRVWDDQAFIRARTGFTFDSFDEGVEIGTQPGPFFLATSVVNGESGDTDTVATVNGYGVFTDLPVVRNVLAGASFAHLSSERQEAAFYAGANLWKFTYLGEFDLIDDDATPVVPGRRDQYAAYAEVNLLLFDWLNLQGTFDFVKVSNSQSQSRFGIGVAPFINRVIQPIIQYRINNGPPGEPALNEPQLIFELHLFY